LLESSAGFQVIRVGTCIGCDFGTLQAAIQASQNQDTILLSPEVFSGVENIGLNITGKSLNFEGSIEGTNVSVIDCTNSNRAFYSNNMNSNVPQYLLFKNIQFRNCSALQSSELNTKDGGTIFIWSSFTIVEIDGCQFSFSSAVDGSAIFASSPQTAFDMANSTGYPVQITIKNSSFGSNVANGSGTVAGTLNLTITGCEFLNNTAAFVGGALYGIGSLFYLDKTNFLSNTAGEEGGSVWLGDSDSYTTNCQFQSNSAQLQGGAWFLENAENQCNTCSFIGNFAGDGGAICIEEGGAYFECYNCTFISNVADNYGGSFYGSDDCACKFENTTFVNGTAGNAGGGVALESGSRGTILNSLMTNNTADRGGALFFNDVDSALTNSELNSNSASQGGGVYCLDSNLNITDSVFVNNSAGTDADFYCSEIIPYTTCQVIGNSRFSCSESTSTNGLSDSEKIAIGVFAGLGAIVVIGAIACIIIFADSKKREKLGLLWGKQMKTDLPEDTST